MVQRLLISTDLTDGVYRLIHCLPHLADTGVTQMVFLHVVPICGRFATPELATSSVLSNTTQLSKIIALQI